MTEEATVDCYNEAEQAGGWFTMIEEHLKLPFETQILGAPASVVGIDMDRSAYIVAACRRGKHRQSVPILDLPIPSPPPAGAEWIEAYQRRTRPGYPLFFVRKQYTLFIQQ
ncbi:MAG: hypothetical protein HZB91_04530 [Elusimicrobia bacterium]|nr:hypothetical protein [Elusimicrobiota bacterium]